MISRQRTPRVADLLVALGTGAASSATLVAAPALLGPAESPEPGGTAWWSIAVGLVLQALLLCAARVAPAVVLVGIAAIGMLLEAVVPTGIGTLTDAAVLVATVRAASLLPARRLRVLLPLTGLLVAGGQAADLLGSSTISHPEAIASGVLQALAIVGLPAAGVLAVAARQEAKQARSGESAAVERERDAVVRAAVARERTAMARELHDIAAHHVSGIALMTAAIDRQIDTDPQAAKRAVRAVREQSRALLDDLRRLVGLLRDDGEDLDDVETLATVPQLVASVRVTGRVVELRRTGDDRGVGPLAQLVVYRMVQESLANIARHAPDSDAVVELDGTDEREFVTTVRNNASAALRSGTENGFGLLGMRERAALVGGSLEAGPDGHGGWTVRLTVPSDRAVARGGEGQ